MSTCRYCGDAIVWLQNERGKWVPVDPETVGDEQVQLYDPKANHVLHFDVCLAPLPADMTEAEHQAEMEAGER
jgi:hypothetical protein